MGVGTVRRIVGVCAVVLGGTVFVYCAWAAHRFGGSWPADWARSFPYPDRWLLALNDHYDAKYPAAGPYVKLHGEWARVMRDVSCAMWSGGATCVFGVVTLLLPAVRRVRGSRERGSAVVSSGEEI